MLLSCWILSEPVSTAALLEHSSFCYTKALTESVWDLSTALFLKNYTLPHLCPSPFSEDSAFIYLFLRVNFFYLIILTYMKVFFLPLIKSVLERQLSGLPFVPSNWKIRLHLLYKTGDCSQMEE